MWFERDIHAKIQVWLVTVNVIFQWITSKLPRNLTKPISRGFMKTGTRVQGKNRQIIDTIQPIDKRSALNEKIKFRRFIKQTLTQGVYHK